MPKLHIHVVNDQTLQILRMLEDPAQAKLAHAYALQLSNNENSFYSGDKYEREENDGNVILNFNDVNAQSDVSKIVSVIITAEGSKKLAWAKNVRCIVIRHNDPANAAEPEGLWAAHIFGGDQTKIKTYGNEQYALLPEQLARARIYNPDLVSATELAKYSQGLNKECELRLADIRQHIGDKTGMVISKPFFTDMNTLKSMLAKPAEAMQIAEKNSFPVIPMPFLMENGNMRICFEDKDPAKQEFSKCRVAYDINNEGRITVVRGIESDFYLYSMQNNIPQIMHIKSNGLGKAAQVSIAGADKKIRVEIDIRDCPEMCKEYIDPSLKEAKRLLAESTELKAGEITR